MISIEKLLHLENGLSAFLLMDCVEKGIIPNPEDADVWIINTDKVEFVRPFLYKIINSDNPLVFLKPIFVNKDLKKKIQKHEQAELKNLCDGYIDDVDLHKKLPAINYILGFTKQLLRSGNEILTSDVLVKTLLYYTSRNKEIEIVENPRVLSGYVYPRLEAYYTGAAHEFKNVNELLTAGIKKGYLKRHYVDTLHLCSKCSSGFLNYREECPKCKSHNLQVRNIIHHYRCAYVGSEDLFKQGDQLKCPKCLSILLNVGVDYDRPGKVYHCKAQSCLNVFQKPDVGVRCINCKKEQKPFDLNVEKIYNYSLTQEAAYYINTVF